MKNLIPKNILEEAKVLIDDGSNTEYLSMKTELIYKQIDKPINVNIDNRPLYCQNENVEDWIELKKDSFSHYGYIKKNYDNTWYYFISAIATIPTTIHLQELIELTAKIKE